MWIQFEKGCISKVQLSERLQGLHSDCILAIKKIEVKESMQSDYCRKVAVESAKYSSW